MKSSFSQLILDFLCCKLEICYMKRETNYHMRFWEGLGSGLSVTSLGDKDQWRLSYLQRNLRVNMCKTQLLRYSPQPAQVDRLVSYPLAFIHLRKNVYCCLFSNPTPNPIKQSFCYYLYIFTFISFFRLSQKLVEWPYPLILIHLS